MDRNNTKATEMNSADANPVREMNLLKRECQNMAARIEKLENAEEDGSQEEVDAQREELNALVVEYGDKCRRLSALRAIVYPKASK
jgi:hypothetical protein